MGNRGQYQASDECQSRDSDEVHGHQVLRRSERRGLGPAGLVGHSLADFGICDTDST